MKALGDRLLSLFAPKTRAAACGCWTIACTTPDGRPGSREICKPRGGGECEPFE